VDVSADLTADLAADIDALTADRLRARGSLKWTMPPAGSIGSFVAEMDFPLAAPIRTALDAALDDGATGYLSPAHIDRVTHACAAFQSARHGWPVDPADVHPMSGVVHILEFLLRNLLPPGTPLVLPTPTYMPFLTLPVALGVDLRLVTMHPDNGRYTMDLEELRVVMGEQVPDTGALLVLINPHNPTGRVFTEAELRALASIVEECGATVFADEIHAPLVYPGHRHVPYASLSAATAAHTLTAVSASKGWNLPGLNCAQLILSSDAHRERWARESYWAAVGTSPLGAYASEAAYRHGIPHLDATLAYLNTSRQLFADELAAALPGAAFTPPEGTYLGWVDLRTVADPVLVADRCQVIGTDGMECGAPGFLRLNLATTHALVAETARRLGRLGRPR
jgi:bifunctional pyridoxal-dependent enzyme with beta-cystathionase and maltose regulon repressor activities